MNISTSECSSGCESGWTMYLDQFSSSTDQCHTSIPADNDYRRKGAYTYGDEEDEDLSMLSDASSGPPHFYQENCSQETRYTYSVSASEQKNKKKHRDKVKEQTRMQDNFHLDDTASSPVLSFSKASHKPIFHQNNAVLENDKSLMELEQDSGYSATHYKGKSGLKKHLGFFKPSRSGKAD